MTETMIPAFKPGTRFMNDTMELTVLCFDKTGQHTQATGFRSTLALLIRSCDGMLITVRNLGLGSEPYAWDWGHYFTDIRDAVQDYDKRLAEY